LNLTYRKSGLKRTLPDGLVVVVGLEESEVLGLVVDDAGSRRVVVRVVVVCTVGGDLLDDVVDWALVVVVVSVVIWLP